MYLQHTLSIDASRDLIWQVTTDIERWPEWTPTVRRARRLDEGPFAVGSAARLEQPGLPSARWEVVELVEGERFSWQTRVRGMRMFATHELKETDGGISSTLSVRITGPGLIPVWPFVWFALRRSLAKENLGLKAHCEARSEDA